VLWRGFNTEVGSRKRNKGMMRALNESRMKHRSGSRPLK
jgi:hypothetical protein